MSDYEEMDDSPNSGVDQNFRRPSEDAPECRSPSSKEHIRQALRNDVESFLNQGGSIEVVAQNARKDPPKKPVSNYGSRPI